MAFRTLVALAVLCALPVAGAGASARPNFPSNVSGTISGKSVSKFSGNTVTTTWTIKKARFKLIHVRSVEGSWNGFYKVTGGEVAYKEVETGSCAYTLDSSFSLVKYMPKSRTTTPLALTRSLTGHDTYDGDITPTRRWTIIEQCQEGEDTVAQQKTIKVGDLFSTGEKSGTIGRAMKGRYTYVDDAPYGKSTDTFTWSLHR